MKQTLPWPCSRHAGYPALTTSDFFCRFCASFTWLLWALPLKAGTATFLRALSPVSVTTSFSCTESRSVWEFTSFPGEWQYGRPSSFPLRPGGLEAQLSRRAPRNEAEAEAERSLSCTRPPSLLSRALPPSGEHLPTSLRNPLLSNSPVRVCFWGTRTQTNLPFTALRS